MVVEAERNKFRDFLAKVPKRELRNAADAVEMVDPIDKREDNETLSVEALNRRSKIRRPVPPAGLVGGAGGALGMCCGVDAVGVVDVLRVTPLRCWSGMRLWALWCTGVAVQEIVVGFFAGSLAAIVGQPSIGGAGTVEPDEAIDGGPLAFGPESEFKPSACSGALRPCSVGTGKEDECGAGWARPAATAAYDTAAACACACACICSCACACVLAVPGVGGLGNGGEDKGAVVVVLGSGEGTGFRCGETLRRIDAGGGATSDGPSDVLGCTTVVVVGIVAVGG